MHHFRPARLDPLHVSTVSNSTFVRYQSAVEKFETFLLLFDAVPSSAAELDEWLVLYRREAALTRSKLETTLAGIQFFAPCLRGNLPLTKKVIKGLAIEFPSKHAFPMLSRSAKFIACKLADEGEYRLGVCMLLQQATGLRPSEMLGLREHDVLRPNELVPRYVLRLGTNVGTKVGREQTAFFDPDQDPVLAMLLFRLLRATPEQGFLANCGYDHYRRVLSRLSALLGVHYSPHSCRAGFATEAIIKGELPAVVQRRGRWYSEASFLVYIDVATAMQVEAEFRSRSLDSEISEAVRSLLLHFPKGCFAGDTHGLAGGRADRRRFGRRGLSYRTSEPGTARLDSAALSGHDASASASSGPPKRSTTSGGRNSRAVSFASRPPGKPSWFCCWCCRKRAA